MRISETFKRILSALLFFAILFAASSGMIYLLEPISYAHWFKPEIKRMEENGEKADLVIAGASRTFRSFDPEILEEKLGMGVINGGTALQSFEGSYYMFKELFGKFHPKYAVLAVTWNSLTYEPGTQYNLIVLDRLSGLNRLNFMRSAFSEKDRKYALSKIYRFRENLKGERLEKIHGEKELLAASGDKPFLKDEEIYKEKGFVYSYRSIPRGNVEITHHGVYDPAEIQEKRKKYLDKIRELCEKEGVELMLVAAPSTLMQIYNIENYGESVEYFEDYARKNGLIFHNLNYLKGREDFLPDTLMMDYNHVNGEGARVISERYAEILKKDMEYLKTRDPKEAFEISGATGAYFHKNLDEMKASIKRRVAVGADISEAPSPDGEKTVYNIYFRSLGNEGVTPYYKAEYRSLEASGSTGGKTKTVAEGSRRNKMRMELPKGEKGILTVKAGTVPDDGNAAWQSIEIGAETEE